MKSLNSTIDRAPEIPGARKLNPDEPARLGDRYMFLTALAQINLDPALLEFDWLAEADSEGCVRVGRSLNDSLADWLEHGASAECFDAVLYRPTK